MISDIYHNRSSLRSLNGSMYYPTPANGSSQAKLGIVSIFGLASTVDIRHGLSNSGEGSSQAKWGIWSDIHLCLARVVWMVWCTIQLDFNRWNVALQEPLRQWAALTCRRTFSSGLHGCNDINSLHDKAQMEWSTRADVLIRYWTRYNLLSHTLWERLLLLVV